MRDIDIECALLVLCAFPPPPRTSLRRPCHFLMGPKMRRPEVGILALAMLASACAIPTEAPSWETLLNVPLPDKGKLNLSVALFLAAGVTADTVANIFTVSVGSPAPITRTLGQDCASCAPVNGTTAPQ